jgi:hypothetical protein
VVPERGHPRVFPKRLFRQWGSKRGPALVVPQRDSPSGVPQEDFPMGVPPRVFPEVLSPGGPGRGSVIGGRPRRVPQGGFPWGFLKEGPKVFREGWCLMGVHKVVPQEESLSGSPQGSTTKTDPTRGIPSVATQGQLKCVPRKKV